MVKITDDFEDCDMGAEDEVIEGSENQIEVF